MQIHHPHPGAARRRAPRPARGTAWRLDRRQLLRGGSVALALPLLQAMIPANAVAGEHDDRTGSTDQRHGDGAPRRMIGICNNLGFLPDRFFPTGDGADYQLSPYLEELSEHRQAFTVFSGVSHPGVDGSHSSDVSFLTAAPHPGSGGFRNTVSLDQRIAAHFGNQTRFPSLTLGVNAMQGRRSLSWTDGGVLIPCQDSAAAVFAQLFLQGTAAEQQTQLKRLRLGRSIMDTLGEQSRALYRRLGAADRDRMDQYTTAVRDVEQQMTIAQQWELRPKPTPPIDQPVDPPQRADYMQKTQLMFAMAKLAFQTDSTRAITLLLDSNNSPTIAVPGTQISDGYHNLSHHGRNESKLQQLAAIDRSHMRLLADFLSDLRSSDEGGTTLLDNTSVIYGSNFGDANKHTTDNLPVILAGGRFRHGRHLKFDTHNNYPLPNLFVSVLQQMGIETDRFASASGTMRGLDFTG